jgi:hypothetical protein
MRGEQKRFCSLLELVLSPIKILQGVQKLTVGVRNSSDAVIRNAILTIHSLNQEALHVWNSEKFIYSLMPGQETSGDFDVFAASDAQVYLSLSGFKNGDTFFQTSSLTYRIQIS